MAKAQYTTLPHATPRHSAPGPTPPHHTTPHLTAPHRTAPAWGVSAYLSSRLLLDIAPRLAHLLQGEHVCECRGRLQLAQDTLATLCSNPSLATGGLLSFVQVCASQLVSNSRTLDHSLKQSTLFLRC